MTRCPSCRGEMQERRAEAVYSRPMSIDVCAACEGIWFDGQELLQMAPAATLSLLSEIVPGSDAARAPLASVLACPRCGIRLLETHDRQRNTPFVYHRCGKGHGKFLTFFQFLKAKNFVRPLSAHEIAEMRKSIRQVNCVNCGAPVNVEREATCGFCRTPLAILDGAQVTKALEDLKHAAADPDAEAKREMLPLTLAEERLRVERLFAHAEGGQPRMPSLLNLFEGGTPLASRLRLLCALIKGQ